MLKIATIVNVLPIPIKFSAQENATISQTALTGVLVVVLTLEKNFEKGRAPSRANAYAIRVSASIAEQPVKNWTRMAKNHITVPPTCPPALRNICAAGSPVGESIIASRSVVQKQNVIVNSQPRIPDIVTAWRMA